jgi:peptidoglycan-associated lipoprotein
MRLRLLAVAGLTVALFGLTGCPPKNGECSSTDDCKGQSGYENDVCVAGKCQECGADSDCKPGFLCQANKCQPKPECSQNADCGAGKECSAGKCVTAAGGCKSNSDCPGGKCLAGACRPSNACNADTDCTGGQTCQGGTCAEPPQCQLERIHFGFNESTLDESAQSTLKANAECILKRKLSVELQGNADERGTEEYNLHLGERRATAAKGYLQKLGVDAGKMKTISFGKERPVNPGHDEAAWSENRRVDVVEK